MIQLKVVEKIVKSTFYKQKHIDKVLEQSHLYHNQKMKTPIKSSCNQLEKYDKAWTYLSHSELPILVVSRAMPPGTVLFETELKAIDFKLNKLSKIQKELEERKRILGHDEIDRQNRMHMEDERIFNQITGR